MKLSNLLLTAFLLLAPCTRVSEWGPSGVFAYHDSAHNGRKTDNSETDKHPSKSNYNGNYGETIPEKKTSPLLAKVRYEPTEEEKCGEKLKIKEGELCRRELQVVKDAAAKWEEKNKKPETCRACEKVVKLEGPEEEPRRECRPTRGRTLCAECERCELQIKADGEGVVLKCSECRDVSPGEVTFPAGNNHRIIRLP